jgi:putative transcriptional regulator
MKTVRMKIDVQSPNVTPIGRIDVKRVDATTEADIANYQAEDDANAMLDSVKYARRAEDDYPLDRMAENARELGLDY